MSSASFAAWATVTASTKRLPAVSGGKRGAAVTNLASLAIVPLMPVDAELRQRLGLASAHELLQTFVDGTGADVAEGDVLVVGGTEYPVRSVADWPGADIGFKHIVVEELKQ